jgi:DsbC/DsbD-like thiol-disulfide interchange protein
MPAQLYLCVLLAGIVFPALAFGARSEWTTADNSQLRLLLTKTPEGHTSGGIEILLEPGWYTYWRNPGEAGIPPIFDFSGSDNLAEVEVRYPAPSRHDDGSSVSLIYENEVVFPLSVKPAVEGANITLRIKAQFGVCREICIPTAANAEVTLIPDARPDPLSNARLREFERRVPLPPQSGRFDVEAVSEDGDALAVDVRMPESTYSDLFVEPPAGWYLGQPAFVGRNNGVSRYRLPLAGKPRDQHLSGQQFRFVAVAGSEAIEENFTIN